MAFKTELMFWLVGISVLIILFIILYFPEQSKKQSMNFVYNKATAITRMTASASIAGLEFTDENAIKDVLNLLNQSELLGWAFFWGLEIAKEKEC